MMIMNAPNYVVNQNTEMGHPLNPKEAGRSEMSSSRTVNPAGGGPRAGAVPGGPQRWAKRPPRLEDRPLNTW